MSNIPNRDKEILQYLSEGDTSHDIGKKLELSHKTIEFRVMVLKAVHEARNSAHLVAIAIKKKLIKL